MVIDDGESRASPAASSTSLVNPFATMMAPQSSKESKMLRDRCFRPTPTYNDNYNPTKPPSELIKAEYSPYDFGEPLFDDREARPSRFPIGHVLAPASKRKFTSWTWKVTMKRNSARTANTTLMQIPSATLLYTC
ncbi:hypothetical protein IFR05_016772 [Cadophora sp. M221]|nr:hypothetical protein IFR05_016772 [Cadophora sp. M221]